MTPTHLRRHVSHGDTHIGGRVQVGWEMRGWWPRPAATPTQHTNSGADKVSTITYVGRDRDDLGRTGRVDVDDVARFVEDRYGQGWRYLVAYRDGEVVGEIGRGYEDSNQRTWWGES